MIIALDIVLLHNDSRGFQILQALQGVTTLRQVLLGIQKQSTAEYPYFSYWLSSLLFLLVVLKSFSINKHRFISRNWESLNQNLPLAVR